jgi:hypothetical protein
MASDLGMTVIQLHGFPPIEFPYCDDHTYISCRAARGKMSYPIGHHLPSRRVRTVDGRVLHLSRKERRRLYSLLKKWDRLHGGYYYRRRTLAEIRRGVVKPKGCA